MISLFRPALVFAVIGLLLALSGAFVAFDQRAVVVDLIGFNDVLLLTLVLGSAAFTVRRSGLDGARGAVIGMASSLLVAAALTSVVLLEGIIDLSFIFPNLTSSVSLTIGFQHLGFDLIPGLGFFLVVSVGLGALGGLIAALPHNLWQALVTAFVVSIALALLADQVDSVISPADGLALGSAVLLGYFASGMLAGDDLWSRLGVGALNGAALGIIAGLIADGGGLGASGILRVGGSDPIILALAPGQSVIVLALILGAVGALGALLHAIPHLAAVMTYFVAAGTLILAGLALRPGFDLLDVIWVFGISFLAFFLLPLRARASALRFRALPRPQKSVTQLLLYSMTLFALFLTPFFLSSYVTNVLNLVGIYVILGIGLSVVVGNAGLLDLGYVAFFAIGAYTVGLLTTPNLLTCGNIELSNLGLQNAALACSGILSFWPALLIAILLCIFVGVLLGLPVLRLRGDYLAIVSLSFGEIMHIMLRAELFSSVLGGTQGIASIPRPVVDLSSVIPDFYIPLNSDIGLYFLILAAILLVTVAAVRLTRSRVGRAWRAVRADEDVAQAMGIQLTRTRLSAFVFGAAVAGTAGAIAATRLLGVYPDSFTLQISMNVLALIVIGGMGSIPGVIMGAVLLIGLPEVLRELADYRLLILGVLLVYVVIVRPGGLLSLQEAERPSGGVL